MKKSFFKSDSFCYIITVFLCLFAGVALFAFAYFFGDAIIADWCKYI